MYKDNKPGSHYHGIGFAGLLTILFVALKLTNVIDWAWAWVLAPIWISAIIYIAIIAIFFIWAFASKKQEDKNAADKD